MNIYLVAEQSIQLAETWMNYLILMKECTLTISLSLAQYYTVHHRPRTNWALINHWLATRHYS